MESTKKAYKNISKIASNTPLAYSPILSEMSGYEVYLKKENLQHTGSFKIRGAFNKISKLVEKGAVKDVITASAGNHGQGVAFTSNYFNINAIVVMPEHTPLVKIMGVEKYGARVILHGTTYDESYHYAKDLAEKEGYDFIHPFNDEDVIEGQGTIAYEVFEELGDIDAFIVPVGGGGLITGVSRVVKNINNSTKVIGVSAAGAPALNRSFLENKVVKIDKIKTIADGIAVKETSLEMLNKMKQTVDTMEEVEEDEIASAILFLLENQKISVEGAGVVGVAALMHKKIKLKRGSKVVIVISGGNIDVTMLNLVIEKGLKKTGRKLKLKIKLFDKPGSLNKLTSILENEKVNIIQIGYDRKSIDIEFGEANIFISMETKNHKQVETLLEVLKDKGYEIERMF